MPGVCTLHNTSRLVRGRLRKIWRHASPRRMTAIAVDARRAIRVEGIFRILLHHQKLWKNTILPIAHVPTSCKKTHDFIALRVLLILTPHRYRRTSTTVSSPSVMGPRPGDASRLFGHATTPPRMYEGPVRCSGGIATPQYARPAYTCSV